MNAKTIRSGAVHGERVREELVHATARERRDELVRAATRLLGNREAAEDVVQDAVLRLLERDAPLPDSPRAWLHRVTRNLAIDRLRRARREREARSSLSGAVVPDGLGGGDDVPPPDEALAGHERRREAIRVLLDGAGPRDAAAIVLREVFGLDYADLARASGRGEAACRQAVSRALGRARSEERDGMPNGESGRVSGPPAVAERADDVLRRFERAVIERDPEPLLDALHVRAVARVDMQARHPASRFANGSGERTTRLRIEADAHGIRLSLVLDGVVLCTLPSRTSSPMPPACRPVAR